MERSLQLLIEAGFDVSISELDVQVWEAWNGQPEGDDRSLYRDLSDPSVADRISRGEFDYWVGKITNRAELEAIQAQRFAEYFAVYKKYSQHIHRVTFWGLTDRLNWRSTHNPQIFNADFSEKLAAPAVANPEKWLGLRAPITDTSGLEEALAAADELDLRGSVWTGKSLAKVKKAIGYAKATLRAGAPQAKVNKATESLLAAIDQLEPRTRPGPWKPGTPGR